jgi:hypothetical protein
MRMSERDAFKEFRDFMAKATHANILMAAEGDESPLLRLQRLTIGDTVSETFLKVCQSIAENDSEFDFIKYEPGYRPDDDEICYLPLSESDSVKQTIDSVSRFDDAELFEEKDEIIDNLKFYGLIVDDDRGKQQAIFFREFTEKDELTRCGWIPLIFERDTYNRVERKIFLFDDGIDCFAWDGYLFILSIQAFQRIFGYFEALKRKADQTLSVVVTSLPISNFNDFTNACKADLRMLAKLAQIEKKPYLQSLTMAKIKEIIVTFNIDVKIVVEGGKEKLVFEGSPSKRWNILKLLDDDYLDSNLTTLKYASNSKRQV